MLKKSKISLTLYIRDNFELILFALAYFLLSINVLYERVIFIQDYLSIIKAISLSLFILQILLSLSKKRYALGFSNPNMLAMHPKRERLALKLLHCYPLFRLVMILKEKEKRNPISILDAPIFLPTRTRYIDTRKN